MVLVLSLPAFLTSWREEAFGCQFVVLFCRLNTLCERGRELGVDKQILQATAKWRWRQSVIFLSGSKAQGCFH